jgi:hypothetical protein
LTGFDPAPVQFGGDGAQRQSLTAQFDNHGEQLRVEFAGGGRMSDSSGPATFEMNARGECGHGCLSSIVGETNIYQLVLHLFLSVLFSVFRFVGKPQHSSASVTPRPRSLNLNISQLV